MNRDDLTPEHVTTKDGNSVIRWKKRDKKKSAATTGIPAPGAFSQRSVDDKPKRKKRSAEIADGVQPKDEKKEQKAARKAENARQMDYIKTEAQLRIRYKGNKQFDLSDISCVMKALREGGYEDPETIVDEDLLISYAEFTDMAWKPYYDNSDLRSGEILASESYRPHVTKLAAYYVTHPEDRERLARVVKSGVYEYDKAIAEIQLRAHSLV